MGTEAVWVPLVMAAVAGGTTYVNEKNTAKRQDNQLAANLRQQGQLQQDANKKTGDLIQKTAASNDTGAKSSLLQDFMTQMQQKQGNATRPLDQVGNVSGAFTQAANDATLGVSQYGSKNAGLLSSIDAPNLQRRAEATDLSRFGTDLGQIKRQSAADQFLSQMRLQGIRRNPWLSAVSSASSAYASAYDGAAAGGDGFDGLGFGPGVIGAGI